MLENIIVLSPGTFVDSHAPLKGALRLIIFLNKNK